MADAHGSGPCVRKDVGVQLPPRPHAPGDPCPRKARSGVAHASRGAEPRGPASRGRLGCSAVRLVPRGSAFRGRLGCSAVRWFPADPRSGGASGAPRSAGSARGSALRGRFGCSAVRWFPADPRCGGASGVRGPLVPPRIRVGGAPGAPRSAGSPADTALRGRFGCSAVRWFPRGSASRGRLGCSAVRWFPRGPAWGRFGCSAVRWFPADPRGALGVLAVRWSPACPRSRDHRRPAGHRAVWATPHPDRPKRPAKRSHPTRPQNAATAKRPPKRMHPRGPDPGVVSGACVPGDLGGWWGRWSSWVRRWWRRRWRGCFRWGRWRRGPWPLPRRRSGIRRRCRRGWLPRLRVSGTSGLGGEAMAAWAPLSGFFAARDGFVRTHANYAPLGAAVCGARDRRRRRRSCASISPGCTALEVEYTVTAAGGISGRRAERGRMVAHPHGSRVGSCRCWWSSSGRTAPRGRWPAPGCST